MVEEYCVTSEISSSARILIVAHHRQLQAGDEALKWCGINAVLCAVFALRLGGYLISSLVALTPEHLMYGQYIEVSALCLFF
jgi:hypothetical protein